jgi:hypothetical protein
LASAAGIVAPNPIPEINRTRDRGTHRLELFIVFTFYLPGGMMWKTVVTEKCFNDYIPAAGITTAHYGELEDIADATAH